MALRVLLADESSTIKKVFQLALQDFAVDVRNVNVGTDVVHVAQDFNPDMIFADVLLQKRNGYEVSAEVKQSEGLGKVPVVLMFSGFMDLDEDKFQASHANAQLEKPFEVQALRKLVTDLVPRTQNQRISQFLTFPKMPEMQEEPKPEAKAPAEDFEQVSIPKMIRPEAKYRVELKPEELEREHVPVSLSDTDTSVDVDALLGGDESDEVEDQFSIRMPPKSKNADLELEAFADDQNFKNIAPSSPPPPPPTAAHPVTAAPKLSTVPAMPAEELERIIRAQSAEVIQDVVWKIVPDLAAQIIERELNKLLREHESALR